MGTVKEWSPLEALKEASMALPDAEKGELLLKSLGISQGVMNRIESAFYAAEKTGSRADDEVFAALVEARTALNKAWVQAVDTAGKQVISIELLNGIDATIHRGHLDYVRDVAAQMPKANVGDLYDNDPRYSGALVHLIPNFEYPDWSWKSAGEMGREVAAREVGKAGRVQEGFENLTGGAMKAKIIDRINSDHTENQRQVTNQQTPTGNRVIDRVNQDHQAVQQSNGETIAINDKVYFGRGPMEFVGFVIAAGEGRVTVSGVEIGCLSTRRATVDIEALENLRVMNDAEWAERIQDEPAFAEFMTQERFLALQAERERMDHAVFEGEAPNAAQFRIQEIDLLLKNSPWSLEARSNAIVVAAKDMGLVRVDAEKVTALLETGNGPDKGTFIGKIVGVDAENGLVFQATGRGDGVVLPQGRLSRPVEVGELATIKFKDGRGVVEDRVQSKDRGR